MEERRFSIAQKAAVLTIAILTFETTMMGPALAVIAKAFPHVSPLMIKQLVALPQLFVVFLPLISGHIERKIGTRTLLFSGMFLQFLGILPAFYSGSNFTFLLWSRVIFGIGLGLLFPLSASVIHRVFTGQERSKLFGYRSSTQAVVGVIFQMAAGYLAAINWRFVFLEFLVQIPLFILIYYKLPPVPRPENKERVSLKDSIKPLTVLMAVGNICYNIMWFSIVTNMAMVMVYEKVGNSVLAGTVMSTYVGACFVSGMLYGNVTSRWFKRYCVPVGLLLQAAGFGVFLTTHSLASYCVAGVIFGLGYATYAPESLFRVQSTVKTVHASVAVGVFMAAQGLGQFLSPLVLGPIVKVFGNSTPIGPWYAAGVGLFLGAVLIAIIVRFTKPTVVSETLSKPEAVAR